jgi:Domain of unknown function (DUF4262)
MAVQGSPSIGLHEIGMPELLVIGLPMDYAHEILMNAFAQMKSVGTVPEDGDFLTGVANFDPVFKDVAPGNQMTNLARGYYGEDVPVMQLVFPDSEGRYQWQPGFDPKQRQTVAYAKKPFLKLV